MMKVVSFNANGIRAAVKNGFSDWLLSVQPDFICLQETKAHVDQLTTSDFFPESYFCHYVSAQKKGYSGVAIFAKKKPHNIIEGTGFPYCDDEGRYVQFDYEKLSIISLYLPSGTSGDGRQDVKYAFLDHFESHLNQLKATGKELIICGDWNIAHKNIDIKNWKSNQKTSGFLPEERAWMDKLLGEMGFIDAFRVHNQEPEHYTWWSYRARAFDKNVGWRIDYQIITEGLASHVVDSKIFKEPRMSDHAPLLIEYQGQYCV